MEGVPWAVNNSLTSPEVGRLLAYSATNGAEGIVNIADLRVDALPVPGAMVRVQPGAALILNRSTSGAAQTYAARNGVAEDVEVAATGSSGGRSDLVVAQIEDPFVAGEQWQEPEDPKVGPYAFSRVIPNVPAGTTRLQDVPGYSGRSAVTLARVDIPASTATITPGMITDLRKVANPRSQRAMRIYPITEETSELLTATENVNGEVWPNAATNNWGDVFIPEWATGVRMTCTWGGVAQGAGEVHGLVWLEIGGGGNGSGIRCEFTRFRGPNISDVDIINVSTGGEEVVPESVRGTTQRVYPKGRITGRDAGAGYPEVTKYSYVHVDLEFYEQAA